MARKKTCPACGEPVADTVASNLRPFCSKRCKMNDLSRWLGGEYRISTPTGVAPTFRDDEEITE